MAAEAVMRTRCLIAGLVALAGVSAARAFEFEPLKPLDVKAVDPSLLTDIYGAWEIRDRGGKKRCRVVLLKEPAIGGNGIEVAPTCKAAFPVMDDIAGWRLLENWTIDLIDPLRKTRLRFETPDNRYVAMGDPKDTAGIDELRKLPEPGKAKR